MLLTFCTTSVFDSPARIPWVKQVEENNKSYCTTPRVYAVISTRQPSRPDPASARNHGRSGVSWLNDQTLHQLIATYGYWAVGIIIGLESMGLPLSGETTLVLSALYAHKHQVKFKRSHRQ